MKSWDRQVQAAEQLLEQHQPHVDFDLEAGLVRHRQLVAEAAAPPPWSGQVPRPGRVRWLGWRGLSCLAGVPLLLIVLLWTGAGSGPVPTMSASTRATPAGAGSTPKLSAATVSAPVASAPASAGTGQPTTRVGNVRVELLPAAEHGVDVTDRAGSLPTESADRKQVAGPRSVAPESVDAPANLPRKEVARPRAQRRAPRQVAPRLRLRASSVQTPDDLLEMQELARAEQVLASRPAQALQLVREGELRFRAGYFRQERRYLEVLALVQLGRLAEARAQAWAFFQDYPGGPYRQRIEAALDPDHAP